MRILLTQLHDKKFIRNILRNTNDTDFCRTLCRYSYVIVGRQHSSIVCEIVAFLEALAVPMLSVLMRLVHLSVS